MEFTEGLFGWVDLATTDAQVATQFYGEVFGWRAEHKPTSFGMDYIYFYLGDELVAGMGELSPEMVAQGAPCAWNNAVLVHDIEAVTARVAAAGGQVLMPPGPIDKQGYLSVIMDPAGAVLSVWQPIEMFGASAFNAPGLLGWNELQARDLQVVLPFYEQVFGWQWQQQPESDYYVIMLPDKPGEDKTNGGAMTMPPNVPAEVPSFWMPYFVAADVDATMATAVAAGGSVLFPAMDMDNMRFGGLTDPTGAAFTVIQF